MHVNILKSFDFSRDGFTTQNAVRDTQAEIPDHLVVGLEAEGYVARMEAKNLGAAPENKTLDDIEPLDAVVIPEDYESLSWPELRSLAAKVSSAPIGTKDDALSAIAVEIERRNAY